MNDMRWATRRGGGGRPMPMDDAVRIRDRDLLTADHPVRRYVGEPLRLKAPLRGLAFAAVLVGIMVTVQVTGGVILSVTTGGDSKMLMSMIGELAGAIAAYAVVVLAMEGRRHPVELRSSRMIGLLWGGLMAFACMAACLTVIALFGGYRIVGFNAGYDPWVDLLTVGLVAGVAEEIIMRGILLRLVEEGLGSWGAVGVSALVFGLLHVTNPDGTLWGGVAIAIEAGLLFGAIYLATRSLWWCIGFHAMWNIAEGPIFGSVVSGTGSQQSWLVARWNGPDLLTGGSFGLEASIVPVILLGGLAIAILIRLQCDGRMLAPNWVRSKRFPAES
ncbi:CPBP family intramembrane metalloprotease [Bifidobacterium callimiconis]|uniref:CPBP family intramembrane glutamic endopeptidase n=1 Tax=Bifidobacterium callimiconis TaxID=2306973 RepID=UPI001BDCC140|nr:CPBP family intramembrane glutamic endopeptidase [Bifidobacterium callimiconis]MBT1176488.1 CPBP family intramembrane metalloprotease [Bifidobacterium callimiconis]